MYLIIKIKNSKKVIHNNNNNIDSVQNYLRSNSE